MSKAFASKADMTAKVTTFEQLSEHCWAYTAEGDPNSGVIIGDDGKFRALPPIHIIPATAFYDYSAKYDRDDTQYLFDIDLPANALSHIKDISVKAATALGCRHMCRVDLIVDDDNQPWILEINTLPGFTSHSLLPKAAAHSGIPVPQLVERLLRCALADANRV